MKALINYFVLEYSMSNNTLIAITLMEQMQSNRTCLMEGIQHDYMPISYHKTLEELEVEAEYVRHLLKSKPMYIGANGRMFVKPKINL
jgi:hypothetical protein